MRGGGWEVQNARCRGLKNARCRKHGDLVDEGVRRCYMYGWSTDPEFPSYDPAQARQPGIPFSAVLRDTTPVRQVLSLVLAHWAIGCSTINIREFSLIGTNLTQLWFLTGCRLPVRWGVATATFLFCESFHKTRRSLRSLRSSGPNTFENNPLRTIKNSSACD